MSVLPTIVELSAMWPLWIAAFALAVAWQVSVRIERHNIALYRLKRKSDFRHKAHMEASRNF